MANPIVSNPEILLKIVGDPEFLKWLKQRYSSRGHAIYVFTSSKYLPKIIENPLLMKHLKYRRARGILEAIPAIKDYALLVYGVKLEFDTKLLRKYLPPKKIEEITESIISFEIKEVETKNIINKALEDLNKILTRNTKYRIPALIAFFTGLRATEIKYMLDNWFKLKKIPLDGAYLIVLNYDRNKKKAYITLMPAKLVEIISKNYPIILTEYWRDHVRHKFGVNIGLFRKSWIAIVSGYLDEDEKKLLEGRLESVHVRHYVKHITLIAQKYMEAFKQYMYLLDRFLENTAENPIH